MKKLLAALFATVISTAAIADTKVLTQTLTVDTDAYTALDVVGGKLTFTIQDQESACPCSGVIQSATLFDASTNEAGLILVLFDTDPSSSTLTDDSAISIADADQDYIIDSWTFNTYKSDSAASNAWSKSGPEGGSFSAYSTADGKIYGALYAATGETPNYDAATDISIKLEFITDD